MARGYFYHLARISEKLRPTFWCKLVQIQLRVSVSIFSFPPDSIFSDDFLPFSKIRALDRNLLALSQDLQLNAATEFDKSPPELLFLAIALSDPFSERLANSFPADTSKPIAPFPDLIVPGATKILERLAKKLIYGLPYDSLYNDDNLAAYVLQQHQQRRFQNA